jgi:uncharacterized protein YbjT (DUF2867 family)
MKKSEAGRMHPWTQNKPEPTIAVLGGSGRFGRPYIQEFLDQDLTVRILARSPKRVAQRFPRAHVVQGNMMNLSDVVPLFSGAAAAFLITPLGGNDDVRIEWKAARSALTAAKSTQLPHLFYLSLVQPARPTGVPLLDVKGRIETMALSSGVPFSSLRTGCYMDIWLAFFPLLMKLGLYLMPIAPCRRFSFTSQRDAARVAVLLMRHNKVLNGSVDVIEPRARTLQEVVNLYKTVTGRRLMPLGRWLLPMLNLLKPISFRWLFPSGASRVSLFNYFNAHDWVGDPHQLSGVLPEFQVTSMKHFLTGKS